MSVEIVIYELFGILFYTLWIKNVVGSVLEGVLILGF